MSLTGFVGKKLKSSMDNKTRLIKKYPNRRLYDTEGSRYIKLVDIKSMIEDGLEIKVIDSQSEEDITRSILLQIILEQESNNEPLFTTDSLENFIRYYGEDSREGFNDYMQKSLQFFHQQQETMQQQMKDMMTSNPMDFWKQSTAKNLAMCKHVQDSFFKTNKSDDN